ncbi:MAG TPA: DUF4433 domain-containing protein [Clostridia bacterium]|nr:DUF4433 domain-containing protein [Clostridia bacterium]
MSRNPEQVLIYHITDVANLPGILQDQALYSDAVMVKRNPEVIGYDHIKQRRLNEIVVPCCQRRKVGEFVPFYFCPRSPMLFALNKGNTGRSAGCQRTVVHLVSTMAAGIATGRAWAISSGNAGAFHTTFSNDIQALEDLDWEAIRATKWQGKQHQKAAEFLLADSFSWSGIHLIGCQNSGVVAKVTTLLEQCAHKPAVELKNNWYY